MDAPIADNDPLLARLLAAAAESRAEEIADLLAEEALPVVDAILGRRLQHLGAGALAAQEDLRGDVVVRLLHRLERLLVDPAAAPIHSFRDYVAVVAYHRLDDFVRQSQPARMALTNRVRYLLGKDTDLALWTSAAGELLAGLAEWHAEGRGRVALPLEIAERVPAPATAPARPRELRALLRAVLEHAGGPVELPALIELLVVVLRIAEPAGPIAPPPAEPDALAQLESQDYLRRLWAEIAQLPLRQRIALLLNLRDGRGDSVARLLPVTGVASPEEVRRLLELEPASFETLWAELPLEDVRIATLLGGITRQQVINLRKSARERLARRMAGA